MRLILFRFYYIKILKYTLFLKYQAIKIIMILIKFSLRIRTYNIYTYIYTDKIYTHTLTPHTHAQRVCASHIHAQTHGVPQESIISTIFLSVYIHLLSAL